MIGLRESARATLRCAVLLLVFAPSLAQVPVEVPDTLRFEGYADFPPASTLSRKDELFFFPCGQCHDAMDPDPEIRELDAPHDSDLNHGRGRLWCSSCHHMTDRDMLRTLLDEPVDFDQAYLVCGGCHFEQQKDWHHGAHGKRRENWRGERILMSCPDCHNPHSPALEARAPMAAPPVRPGLERADHEKHEPARVWEQQKHE